MTSLVLSQWVPPGGITLVSYLLHAHLLGTRIQVDLYRQGKPVGIIAVEDNYDFNFQESRLFTEPVKIMPVCASSYLQKTRIALKQIILYQLRLCVALAGRHFESYV